jgi:hypothetical protein
MSRSHWQFVFLIYVLGVSYSDCRLPMLVINTLSLKLQNRRSFRVLVFDCGYHHIQYSTPSAVSCQP